MKFQTIRGRLLTTTVIGGAVAAVAAPAFAQQASGGETTVREVVVTGSRIPRPNLTSVSPVTTVNSQEVKLEGDTDTVQLLNELPETRGALGNTPNPLSSAIGYTTADLRGLGCNRTLVLQDGQRLAPGDANSSCANLDSVPVQLIDRVEVVTGGASAVYGSDAVAGVVNFIMKKDFQGVQLDVDYGFALHDNGDTEAQNAIASAAAQYGPGGLYKEAPSSVLDGRTTTVTLTMGINSGDGKGNITGYLTYKRAEPISEGDRDYSACEMAKTLTCFGTSNSDEMFDIATSKSVWAVAGGPGANKFVTWGTAQTVPGQEFNSQPYEYLSRDDTRYQGGFIGHYDVNSHVQVYSSFNYMDDKSNEFVAPGGSFAGPILSVNCDNPLLPANATQGANPVLTCTNPTAQNPAGVAQIELGRRNIEGGPRESFFDHAQLQGVIGVKGPIDDVWSYNLAASYGQTDESNSTTGYFSLANLKNALMVQDVNGVPTCESVINGTDTNCVPYNPWVQSVGFGKTASNVNNGVTAAALKYLEVPSVITDETTQQDVNLNLVGQLGRYGVKSPWATEGVGVSLGAEYRREYIDISPDLVNEDNLLDGGAGAVNPVSGAYDVKEVYGELLLPIAQDQPFFHDLSMETGYRRADYSSVGSVGSYKFGAQWAPISDFRFRGSFERAVRAPNVTELYTPEKVGNTTAYTSDPCAGSVANGKAQSGTGATLAQCQNTGVTAAEFGHIVDCVAGQCGIAIGGNAALRPETSDTTELGFVFTPSFIRNFNLTVDWFNINVMNAVSTLPANDTLDACLYNDLLCNLVKRNSLGYLWGPQSVAGGGYVQATNANIGYLQTKGMDFEANYRLPLKDLGLQNLDTVDFLFQGTWTQHFIDDPSPSVPAYDCAGLFGVSCGSAAIGGPIPAWRHRWRVTWNSHWNFQASLQWRFISGMENEWYNSQSTFVKECPACLTTGAGGAPLQRTIPDYNYFDLTATWKVKEGLVLRTGVNNIFDKDPPVISAASFTGAGAPNTYPMYDVEGRTIFVSLTANW
jgi:iron complex outermembrane recepter protein